MQVEGMRRAGSTAQRDQYPVWPLRRGERGTEAGAHCPVGGGAAPLVVPPRLGSEITQRGGGVQERGRELLVVSLPSLSCSLTCDRMDCRGFQL